MITFVAILMVLASVAFVAWPLLRGTAIRTGRRLVEDTEVSDLLAQKDATLFAISELESDHEMGSMSNGDYHELRKKYEEKALGLIKRTDDLRAERGMIGPGNLEGEMDMMSSGALEARLEQDIESKVMRMRAARAGTRETGRACPGCGTQSRPDDLFCSRCGAALGRTCPNCSARVGEGDRFCGGCGAALGAGGHR
ncbi:MAG: zinc ribbon domain-containing protein [Chloroflexi bacterium]|nr:zinc ribbon domain-containing protein [Chloroflexota bacterium]